MILSDKTLMKMLDEKTLVVSPLEPEQIQPASIDIRIGNTYSILEDSPFGTISLDKEIKYKQITTDKYLLLPGQFVLATTMEYFELPDNLTAFVEGRSSLGRMGLFIQNAGWVDPGFKGEITLELFNANRCAIELNVGRRVGQLVFAQLDDNARNPYRCAIELNVGRRVGQLVFAQLDDNARNPYRGKYQGQRGATGSKVFLDKETLYKNSGL